MRKAEAIANLGIAANIAVIVAATLFCVVLVKHYVVSQPQAVAAEVPVATSKNNQGNRLPVKELIQPGTKFNLSGVDWAKNGKTLVLAVSDKCHFCSESAPFYQRLAREHGQTTLLALLPQPINEGKSYLNKLEVQVDAIQQAALNSVGVRGTPTLILVDANGTIANSWVGKLAAKQEDEVLTSLK